MTHSHLRPILGYDFEPGDLVRIKRERIVPGHELEGRLFVVTDVYDRATNLPIAWMRDMVTGVVSWIDRHDLELVENPDA